MTVRRVLVTGSRDWPEPSAVHAALNAEAAALRPGDTLVVVHGACPDGADRFAAEHTGVLARLAAMDPDAHPAVVEEPHPADWGTCLPTCPPGHRRTRRDGGTYCPDAGLRRNTAMVASCVDYAYGFRLDGSAGTTHCLREAFKAHIDSTVIDAHTRAGT